MAFVKKTWKDRIVQYANRRLLTKSGGEVEQVTVTRDEGTISEAGDQFNASNMNDLEQRVEDGLTSLTASEIEYSSGVTVKQAIDSKANITALPFVKYEEINVTLDNSGEGTLFTTNKYVVGIKDIPSDSLYVGYIVYFTGTLTRCKAFSRSALAFTSQGIVSMTRKIGVYYLNNISTT